MRTREEYEKELESIVLQLQQIEEQMNQLRTQGIKLQGIIEELIKDENEKKSV